MTRRALVRAVAAGTCVIVTASGCAFQGVNSLPLPGAVGRGSDAVTYHVQIANVSTLESKIKQVRIENRRFTTAS